MKVLVTGGSGLLGRAVCGELRGGGFDVVGTAFSRVGGGLIRLDVVDRDAVLGCIEDVGPDFVIHCAATRKPDVCEGDPEETQRLNVDATKWVAEGAAKVGAWMIHISTDYVFDGSGAPYYPDSAPNPLNAYGLSKLASERVVPEVCGDYCILRVPILYGQVESLDESPISVIAGQLMSGEGLEFDHWATRYPTHTSDVGFVLRQMIEHKTANAGFGGICHWSGDEAFTKFEMAEVMCDVLNIGAESITGQSSPAGGTVRPKNTHLDCGLLESVGIGRQRAFRDGVAEMIRPFVGRS
jgi:dTDP-4-dehydrorhamnose reductase